MKNVVPADSERTPGIGAFATRLILDGKTNAEILRAITEQFPEAKTTTASLNWYRTQLRKKGKEIPPPHLPKTAPDVGAMPIEKQSLSTDSSLLESVLEHLFVGDLLRCMWLNGNRDMEVLRSEVDRGGYDLVVEYNHIVRHIQLKASARTSPTARVNISLNLAKKPSGCVIWLWYNPNSMSIGPFLWFGNPPGQPLPPLGDRVTKHSKGNKDGKKTERPNLRVVSKGSFRKLDTMMDVIDALFGSVKNPPRY